MILVFGGTTEGKQVIELLDRLQLPYFYTTKTEINVTLGSAGSYRFGAFSNGELATFIKEQQIDCCINASHPFATVLHKMVAKEFEKVSIPVIRLDREYPPRCSDKDVYYVSDYLEAIDVLKEQFSNKILLGLSGVQTIEKLADFWKYNPSYFRILDRQSSIDIAKISEYPVEQLILGYPNTSLEAEVTLYREKKIEVVLTKESGNSGSLSIKINAAKIAGIPIIIIKKRRLPNYFQLAKNTRNLESLLKALKK